MKCIRFTEEQADIKDKKLGMKRSSNYINSFTKCDYICKYCGEKYSTLPKLVWRGESFGHKKCWYNKNSGQQHSNYQGFKEIPKLLWNRILKNAKLRNINVNIKIKDIYNQFIAQNKKCYFTGLELIIDSYRKKLSNLSIDRLDSNKDYSVDNIVCVHQDINKIKYTLSENEFLNWCNLITNPIYLSDRIISLDENLCQYYFNKLNREAISRNFEFNLTIEETWNKYIKQNGCCAITGIELYLPRQSKNRKFQTASLDRIDSSKGYLIDNIQWTHKIINRIKWNFSIQDFKKYANLVINNYKGKI